MVRTQISFDEELYRRAKRIARRRGVSLAELCRQGLTEVLAREPSSMPWMRHAGALASGDDHASDSVDAIVYGRAEP